VICGILIQDDKYLLTFGISTHFGYQMVAHKIIPEWLSDTFAEYELVDAVTFLEYELLDDTCIFFCYNLMLATLVLRMIHRFCHLNIVVIVCC